eukprot:TRINITY_DN4211_c0_g4_i1.p1 TRINITY_DN4211_c0_g4~~TRINITY_DN4211_c0_g4_i1.p1  ORF type:complete len:153 (-),score=20.05 TRINITY_DN4211_c0_g4_i1:334-792(-)
MGVLHNSCIQIQPRFQEAKTDMEIIPKAEIGSTTYACLAITSTDNENTKSMFEAIKSIGHLSPEELNQVRITNLAKEDSWQISSSSDTILEKLVDSKVANPVISITRRPDSDQQFPKERQRWIQIYHDIPSADRNEYLNALANCFWKTRHKL